MFFQSIYVFNLYSGNNYFDAAFKDKLLHLKESEERAAYIH